MMMLSLLIMLANANQQKEDADQQLFSILLVLVLGLSDRWQEDQDAPWICSWLMTTHRHDAHHRPSRILLMLLLSSSSCWWLVESYVIVVTTIIGMCDTIINNHIMIMMLLWLWCCRSIKHAIVGSGKIFGYLSYDITVASIANIAQFRHAGKTNCFTGANLLEIPIGFSMRMRVR